MTPPLPRALSELGAWGVFADLLIERGDRLGNHLALELALPAVSNDEQLASFQKSAAKVCRTPAPFSASWMLGHVHTLSLTPDLSKSMPPLEGDVLPVLGELLRMPVLSGLEQLSFSGKTRWRRCPEAVAGSSCGPTASAPATRRRCSIAFPRRSRCCACCRCTAPILHCW